MRKLILLAMLLAVIPVASVFGYTGLAPDEIVFFEEVDQAKVLSMMETGQAHLYGNAFTADLYQDIQDAGLPVTFSYGSFNEILLNPAVDENDEPFFNDGRFNPFGIQDVREAMYCLIDRNYIIDEFVVGLGVARWTMLDPNFPPYASAIEATRGIELTYQHDEAKASALITQGMEAAGAEKVDGKWMYNGEPATIIALIRIEDERLEIGNYVADLLEAQGFTVDRMERKSSELAPLWLLDDPANGAWSYYTGGWISNLIDRDQGSDFDFMYTPRGWTVPLNQGFPIHLFPELDAAADALGKRDYNTVAERVDLLGQAERGAADAAWRQWLLSAASPWASSSDVRVGVDIAAGVSGAYIWAHTARFVDENGAPVTGGTIQMASPSMFTQPWNPVDGSNWLYDAMIQRATEDWFGFPDPFTGLIQPHLIDSATCTVLDTIPMTATLDYVTMEKVSEIVVPADAWVDWNATDQVFITAAEKFPDGLTAKTKTEVVFVDDLFENPWHDGSTLSLEDMLLQFIMTFDRAKEDSVYYDEGEVDVFNQFISVFKGARVTSTAPLTIEVYHDSFYLDASVQAWNRIGGLFWPYYSQGMSPWHTMAVGLKAEGAETTAFSEDKADKLGVDRQNWISGESFVLLQDQLAIASDEGFIPYEPTLGAYITADEVSTRYANLSSFIEEYGHMWVGNGPMMISEVNPMAKIITGKRFDGYLHEMDKFLVFAAPRFADIKVNGPMTATKDVAQVLQVLLTEDGEAYPAEDIDTVKFLVLDANGEIAFSGEGDVMYDGEVHIILSQEDLAALPSGSTTVEIIAVLKPVARPSIDSFSFVLQ